MQPDQNNQSDTPHLEPETTAEPEHSQEVHVPPSHMQPQPPTKRESVKGFKPLLILLILVVSLAVGLGLYRFITDRPASIEQNLTVNEQLEGDLNVFGLGLNNYIERNDSFELNKKSVAELRISYLPLEFTDPRTNEMYEITQEIPKVGDIQYIRGGKCSPDGSIRGGGDNNTYAIRVFIDSNSFLCKLSSEVRSPSSSGAQAL